MGYLKRAVEGKATICPNEARVEQLGAWVVKYTVGRGGIKVGGGIRIAFEHGSDWGIPQCNAPGAPNYVTAKRTDKGILVATGMYYSWSSIVDICVKGKSLRADGTIEVTLGDRTCGSPGFKCQTISQQDAAVNILEDTEGDGNFQKFLFPLTIRVRPEEPAKITVIAKSFSKPGEETQILIRAEDKYGNTAESFTGKMIIGTEKPREVRFHLKDNGIRKERIIIEEPGIKRFKVEGREFSAISNPIIANKENQEKIFWGQIHGHTILSDGLGSVDDYFGYARDVSNLDFASVTDHGIWTDADSQEGERQVDIDILRHYSSKKEWDLTKEAVRKFYKPKEFVTLLGYEWCSQKYGDKNVYFFDNEEMLEHPNTPKELYRALEGRKVIIISHMMLGVLGKRCVDWSFFHSELERCVEICSFHGIKEYAGNDYFACDYLAREWAKEQKGNMVQDALGRGYRLGLVGGSDDHSGKPGSSVNGILPCPINGLTAAWMKNLTKKELWESLYHRRCYATTGARIVLYFSLNGFEMGSEIKERRKREVNVKVYGTAKIRSIEVVKNNKVIYAYKGKGFDEEIWYEDKKEKKTDYYYIRIRQEDGEMAWSSPIWVDSC